MTNRLTITIDHTPRIVGGSPEQLHQIIEANRNDSKHTLRELTRQILAVADSQLRKADVFEAGFEDGASAIFVRAGGRVSAERAANVAQNGLLLPADLS